jgi:peroxiredoxin Q/BCP
MSPALLALALLLPAEATTRPAPGDTAPAFSAAATTGDKISLDAYKGKTVVLAFFPKAFTAG